MRRRGSGAAVSSALCDVTLPRAARVVPANPPQRLICVGSRSPNWVGQEQKRVMSVTGDQLNLTNPAAAVGGTNYVVFKRAR